MTNRIVRAALALALAGGTVLATAPAQAVVTTYTNTINVVCNGHPLKVWATFQSDSSNGKHRGIRGGFTGPDYTQMYSKLGVVAYGATSVTSVTFNPQVIAGSGYSTGSWQISAANVQVVPWRYPGSAGTGCNGGLGYVVND
jgi:hypothetical protein